MMSFLRVLKDSDVIGISVSQEKGNDAIADSAFLVDAKSADLTIHLDFIFSGSGLSDKQCTVTWGEISKLLRGLPIRGNASDDENFSRHCIDETVVTGISADQ